MQKNTFALLFLFILLPLFFICNKVSAPYYDGYGNLVPYGSEHEEWRARQGSSFFDDRMVLTQRSNPFDDPFLYEDFSPRPVRRQQFHDGQFDQSQYYDGSQVDDDRAVQRHNQSQRWLEEVASGDHSSRTFQDFEARQLSESFYQSQQQQRVALMIQDERSMEDDLPFMSDQSRRLRIQELVEQRKLIEAMRKSSSERETDRTLLRSRDPIYAEMIAEEEAFDEEFHALWQKSYQSREERMKRIEQQEKIREKREAAARKAARRELEAAGFHPRTLIQRAQDKLGAGVFKKRIEEDPNFVEERDEKIKKTKEFAQRELESNLKKLMDNESSSSDDFVNFFERETDENGSLKKNPLSTAALFTYVRTAAQTTEELNNQLDIINAIKTPLTREQVAEKADLERSLASLKKLRKGLAARIKQERDDAQKRLLAAKKRVDSAKKTVISEPEEFDATGKKKIVKRTHKQILTFAQTAVQNEVDRLDYLKKLTSKKTFETTKRGALFGGEDQRITAEKIGAARSRELVRDDRPTREIGRDVQKLATGKSVPPRPTRLAPRH